MTSDQIDHYRRVIDTRRLNHDPLIVVQVDDLTALLDCWQWYAENPIKLRAVSRPLTEPEMQETHA